MELQLELQRRGIPFSIRSGQKFFEQAHIRDLLSHLKVLFNPLDRLAWVRLLKLQTGIGNRHALGIFDALAGTGDPWQALRDDVPAKGLPPRAREGYHKARGTLLALGAPGQAGNPGGMLDYLLADGGYGAHLERTYPDHTQRSEDVRQLAHYASQFGDYAQFLEDLALVESVGAEAVQSGAGSDERLLLSTVHQSKGLEWEAVYVIGLADGQFPLRRALRSDEEEEEERRLFYVGVTRARRFLHLCTPQWGTDRDHRRVLMRPSRFLQELPHTRADLVETWRLSEG
jgi:DNA helicase-2/ATP-dependent DNA helicase PcrA